MLTFEELGHGDCRWPVGDCGLPGEKAAFLFCGEAAAPKGAVASGCPYCADHMTAAYKRPPAVRRPRRAVIETHGAGRQKLIELAADI